MIHSLPSHPSAFYKIIETPSPLLGIEVYYIGDRKVFSILSKNIKNGEKVYVIIDQHPYGISKMKVDKEYKTLKKLGAFVKFAPERFDQNYVFDHAKFMVTNQYALIGTMNWDWSAFHKNREFYTIVRNNNIVDGLKNIFMDDWKDQKANINVHNLVISPNSENKILNFINNSNHIMIETEEFNYVPKIIDAVASKGAKAEVLLNKKLSYKEKRVVSYLVDHKVKVKFSDHLYIHAKMMVNNHSVFIGSENFSETSLKKNREVGIILNNPVDVKEAKDTFLKDFNNN